MEIYPESQPAQPKNLSKVLIPNSTQVPNFLLDAILPVASPAQWKVITFVCRKTYGWQKSEDRISLTQFERGTGLSREWLNTNLQLLVKVGLLLRVKGARGNGYSLNLNCDVEAVTSQLSGLVNAVDQSTQLTETSQLSGPKLVNSVDTHKPKKPTTKPTIGKKSRLSSLPDDFCPNEANRQLATSLNVNLQDAIEAFRDFHLSKGSTYKDWNAALNTWIRNERKFGRGPARQKTLQLPTDYSYADVPESARPDWAQEEAN